MGTWDDANGRHGYLLDVDGSYTTLDVPGADDNANTSAQGINDAGQIVGWYIDVALTSHGFLMDVDGSYTTLDPPDSNFTNAFAINCAGQIVGGYAVAGGRFHGFLATPQ